MTAWHSLHLGLVVALAVGPGCGPVLASEPWPEPHSVAADTPAFQAPEEPPESDSVLTVASEPSGPLTFDNALALALMQNPELQVFSWDVRASEARELQADKIPNPRADIRLWRLGERDGIEDIGRRRIIFSQNLELGGKRARRVDFARTEVEIADLEYEAKRIEVATSVESRFVEVLGAQRRVEILGAFVDYFAQLQETVSVLVETGNLASVEIHRVSRRVGLARIDLHSAEAELAAARHRLAATWGRPTPQFAAAVGDLEQVKFVPDLNTVQMLAEQSPAVTRWELELARSHAALSRAKAGRVPDLEFGLGVRWEERRGNPDYVLDLEIDVPLYDRKQGDIREARYNAARAQAGRQLARSAGGAEIAQLYSELRAADAQRLTLATEVVPPARAAFEAFQLAFDATAANLDDLMDARRDLARAEVQYTESLVDCRVALAALERVVGQSLSQND